MKTTILVVLSLLLIASLSFSQDTTPKTKAGDKAMLFTVSGLANFGAGNYQGGVGGKFYLSDGMAFRAALGFGMTSTTTKTTGGSTTSDEKVSSTSLSIAPGIQYNLTSSGPVVPYLGGQVSFTLSSTTDENPGFVTGNKTKSSTTTFGVAAFMGVEWFAWNNISFGAEYQLGFTSQSGTNEVTVGSTTTSTDAPSVTRFNLGAVNAAALTAAVYW